MSVSTLSWTRVSSGVPQGPVLGPLLLIAYINVLELKVCSGSTKFADETKVYSKFMS